MHDSTASIKPALVLDIFGDGLVGILDVSAGVGLDNGHELAILVDGHRSLARLDDPTLDADLVIVLTEAWSTVHHAGTGVFGHEIATKDLEATVFAPGLEEGEKRLVALADEGLALELVDDLVLLDLALLEDVVEASLHANVYLTRGGVLPADVVHLGVDG